MTRGRPGDWTTAPRTVRGWVLGVALALVALGGCAHAPSSDGQAASPTASADVDSFYPFAGLADLSTDQQKMIFDAKQSAIAACMKSRGFEYLPEPYQPPERTVDPRGDVAYARTHGYGLNYTGEPDQGTGATPEPPPRNDMSHMPESTRVAWEAALGGRSIGDPDAIGKDPDIVEIKTADGASYFSRSACITYADEQIQGDEAQWMTAEKRVQDLASEVGAAVDADPRIAAKNKEWAACMAGRGYHVTVPEKAPDLIMDRVHSGQITASEARKQEITMATADAECVNTVGIPQARRQVTAEHAKAVTEAHENDIMAFVELRKKAVDRATALARQ